MRKLVFVLAALVSGASIPAHAALITKTIDFSANDFVDLNGSAVPLYSSASGSFTLTFDTSLDYAGDTANIIVNSFSGVPVASPFGFTYYASSGFLFIGGTQNGPNYVGYGTDDYALVLDLTNLAAPRAVTCADPGINCGASTGDAGILVSGYTSSLSNTAFFQKAAATVVTSDVPEPASWMTMMLGFAGIGALARRRRLPVAIG
ncbi:PEP-CTERM sorting domain-containing protein [Sphingomonas sp.]|uniref:PEP-CTERM sorting domain-containing protein n=1 Tax=Sphingomonas sp. TaxID=28214 RepID=UPI000DB60128|nr:PEP-CTERM sorting domain-containing protein [Sphingomonas sp.]PZU09519.1 MAG: hypothetical protein DI605_07465 [Sphingomonas sp.]